MELSRKLGSAARHRRDGGAAVTLRCERSEVGARGRRNLLSRHVGRDRRLAEDADVDEQHLGAVGANLLAKKRVLLPFRVEGPEERDRGAHASSSRLMTPR